MQSNQSSTDYIYFGFWKRVCMRLIDIGILIIPYLILYTIAVILSVQTNSLLPFITLWIISCSFFVVTVSLFGGTPGKLIMKARIVTEDGKKLTVFRSILRSVFYILYGTVTILVFNDETFNYIVKSPYQTIVEAVAIVMILSDLFVLFNKRKRALHDFIAGSIVIKNKL